MESRYIFVVDMDYVDEIDVVVHCEAYIVMYRRENRFDHLIFTSKKKVFYTCCFAERHENDMRIRPEVRKNILRKISL